MSWPKNKGINRHDKQKRGTAVCSAGKEVSMEKKRNRQKRISKKISKKRNIAAAFIPVSYTHLTLPTKRIV